MRDDLLGGSPVVRGTRIPVRRLWFWHRKGVTVETLVRRYPSLGWAKVMDAIGFAYDNETLVEADLDRERALIEDHPDRVAGRLPLEPRGPQLPLPAGDVVLDLDEL